MLRLFVLTFSIALATIGASSAIAAYPDRPLRLIVPFPPGGNIDITARTLSPGLTEALGVQVVVDNRGGAGGTIGSEMAAKAPPDGYTLLMGSTGTLATAQAFYPKLGFDPLKDFAYTSTVSSVALVAVTSQSLQARTVKEVIALAKSRPGRLTIGSAGTGASLLTGELFQSMTQTKLVHVPYKGAGPAMIDLMGGQIDLMFDQISSAVGHIQSGRIHALAVTTLKRSSALPNVPTMDEAGLKAFEASTRTAILLPAKTPRDIVDKVRGALVKVLRQPSTRESFAKLGAEVIESTPEELDKLMRAETVKWTKVIRDGNIKIE